MSRRIYEISEKTQKSLITPIMIRLHRLESIETKGKSVKSVFEICVIRERKLVFQSSLYTLYYRRIYENQIAAFLKYQKQRIYSRYCTP